MTTRLAYPAGPHPASLGRSLRPPARAWTELRRRQPTLAQAGAVFALLGVACLLAWSMDPRTLNGVSVWLKPFKFYLSIAVYFWTFAWFFGHLNTRDRDGFIGRLLIWPPIAGMILEMAYITLQAARGVHSHFNLATPVEAWMFNLMGAVAALAVTYAVIMGAAIAWRRDETLPPLGRDAVALGLILGGVLGGYFGMAIGDHGGHLVGSPADDGQGLPVLGWSRGGGDLRVAHFVGLHAMQAIPLAGFVLARSRHPALARWACWSFAAVWAALAFGAYTQAAAGRPFLPFLD